VNLKAKSSKHEATRQKGNPEMLLGHQARSKKEEQGANNQI